MVISRERERDRGKQRKKEYVSSCFYAQASRTIISGQERERETERDRQTDKQTDRQTETETDRQTDRQRQRQRTLFLNGEDISTERERIQSAIIIL